MLPTAGLERGSYVTPDNLKLTIWLRDGLELLTLLLSSSDYGTMGMYHHAWFHLLLNDLFLERPVFVVGCGPGKAIQVETG